MITVWYTAALPRPQRDRDGFLAYRNVPEWQEVGG